MRAREDVQNQSPMGETEAHRGHVYAKAHNVTLYAVYMDIWIVQSQWHFLQLWEPATFVHARFDRLLGHADGLQRGATHGRLSGQHRVRFRPSHTRHRLPLG